MDTKLMNESASSPLQYYLNEGKSKHQRNAQAYFDLLKKQAAVDGDKNKATVARYNAQREKIEKLSGNVKKYKRIRGWSIAGIVVAALGLGIGVGVSSFPDYAIAMILAASIVAAIAGICVVAVQTGKKIKHFSARIADLQEVASVYLREAQAQMEPLNRLFSDYDCLHLVTKTLPFLSFDRYFNAERLRNLTEDYGYNIPLPDNESVYELLSGELHGRPFLFEERIFHYMGVHTYTGSLTISWTTRERDSRGQFVTRHHSQVLHASVTKPYPCYSRNSKLYFGHEASPDLRFSRTATHAEKESERALERKIRAGEEELEKLAVESAKKGGDFNGMENLEFDVLFGATNRNDEQQFRYLFTMRAQESMLQLLVSEEGYGDDFSFSKNGKINTICSEHAQQRNLSMPANIFYSHDLAQAEKNFIALHNEFFKSVYFDFAPLLTIPVYRETYLLKNERREGALTRYNYEAFANKLGGYLAPQNASIASLFKASLAERTEDSDIVTVNAFAYVAVPRTTYVTKHGGDGHFHQVPVHWNEYIPVQRQSVIRLVTVNENESFDKLKAFPDCGVYHRGIYAYLP